MGRSPSRDENGLKKGPWTPEEDRKLVDYIERHGHGSWRALPKLAGLNRCGKSCRLRWSNYLRPDIKRGKFSEEEEQLIINLHSVLGNKWSTIATRLPGRTDNEIKNFWNTHLRKKLLQMGIDPVTHRPRTDHHLDILANLPQLLAAANFSINPSWDFNALRTLQYPDATHTQLAKFQLLQNILQVLSTNPTPTPTMESLNLLGSMPFRDHQLSEYLRFLNPRFEGILDNSPIGLAPYPDPDPIISNFPNSSEFPHQQHTTNSHDHDQPMPNSLPLLNDNSHQFIPNIPTSYSIPALVSASPERPTLNQMGNKIINPSTDHHISNPSSTSTTFDAWGELMDDEASDSYWRDIMDQASSPQWPVSS